MTMVLNAVGNGSVQWSHMNTTCMRHLVANEYTLVFRSALFITELEQIYQHGQHREIFISNDPLVRALSVIGAQELRYEPLGVP